MFIYTYAQSAQRNDDGQISWFNFFESVWVRVRVRIRVGNHDDPNTI